MIKNRFRVAGLVSASGSTAAAVCKACRDGRLDAEVPLVIINQPLAAEKVRAIPDPPKIVLLSRRAYSSSEAYGDAMLAVLKEHGIDGVGMWGFDPKVPDNVLRHYAGRIWNQHPDLTPWFGGLGMNGVVAVCARLNFARVVNREFEVEPVSHLATAVLDDGDIVKTGYVPVYPDDTCESLYARVKLEEYEVQIVTVADLIDGGLHKMEVHCPVRDGEEGILAEARAKALEHHAGAKQSALKQTKG